MSVIANCTEVYDIQLYKSVWKPIGVWKPILLKAVLLKWQVDTLMSILYLCINMHHTVVFTKTKHVNVRK